MQPNAITLPEARKQGVPISLRPPEGEDGAAIWQLIKECGTLDENSMYCNLLQCTHFAQTCAVAEMGDEPVGWVSGYIPPDDPEVLFIWQVCVSDKARGQGIAKRLIKEVLERDVCRDVTSIHSTITLDNDASWALFGSMAEGLDAQMRSEPLFKREEHFDGAHDTEHLVMIGPFHLGATDVQSKAA